MRARERTERSMTMTMTMPTPTPTRELELELERDLSLPSPFDIERDVQRDAPRRRRAPSHLSEPIALGVDREHGEDEGESGDDERWAGDGASRARNGRGVPAIGDEWNVLHGDGMGR